MAHGVGFFSRKWVTRAPHSQERVARHRKEKKKNRGAYLLLCPKKSHPVTTQMHDEFKATLLADFKVEDRGNLEHFLGYKILRDRVNRKLKLSQAASLLKALKEAGMTETERKMTPAPTDCKPHKKDCPDLTTEEGKEMKQEMDSKPYANRVGSLLWLARTHRFDISWVVGMLARFMSNPGRTHWPISTYVYKFLNTTKDRGFIYSHRPDGMTLVGSSAGCKSSMRLR